MNYSVDTTGASAARVNDRLNMRLFGLMSLALILTLAARSINADTPTPHTESQKPQAIHLSRDVLDKYVGKYEPDFPPGSPPPPPGLPPIEVAADDEGLWVTFSVRVRELPVSETEFFNPSRQNGRITFTKDAAGHVTGFLMTGLDTGLGGPSELKVKRLP